MSDRNTTIVPKGRRDDIPPPAPLDPYVTLLLRWIVAFERRLNPTTLAKQASLGLAWPLPFADAIVIATRARHLIAPHQVSARGGYGIGLTSRGRTWLERANEPARSSSE